MKKSAKIQAVTIRRANLRLMSTGVIVKGARSSNGTVTINLERGSLNHHRVVSKDEIRKAYKVALKGNA